MKKEGVTATELPTAFEDMLEVKNLPLSTLDRIAANCDGLLAFEREGDAKKSLIRLSDGTVEVYKPTTNWALCGPMLRDLIRGGYSLSMSNYSMSYKVSSNHGGPCSFGPTPEVAIVRAFVTSRLGEFVAASVAGLLDCEVA